MVNRGAVLLRYREPAVQWINAADPAEDGPSFTLADVNRERTVYLVSDATGDSEQDLRHWIQDNYQTVPKLWTSIP